MSDHAEHGHAEEHGGHEAHAAEAHGSEHEAHAAEAHGGGHEAHAAEAHGGGHEAHATEAHGGHGEAHTAHGNGHEAHAPATGTRPITAFRDKLLSSESTVVAGTSAFGNALRKILRAGDLPPVEKKSLLETPFYAAGHVTDGTVLNGARRALEVTEPAISGLRAFFRSTIGTVLRPIHSLTHPIQTLKNPLRIATSVAMMAKNAIMSVPRAAHEFADRAVHRTIEQVSTQIERIPVIGSLITTPVKWISKFVKNSIASVTNLTDMLTSPIDVVHNAVAPR